MKLPDVDYSAPVQSSAGTAALPFDAAAQASRVISQGLQAYGQELVKTQHQEASTTLLERLNQVENAIKAKREMSQDELRATFGDQIPAQARGYLDKKDPVTGEPIPIPMWAIGDALYEQQARKAVEDVSGTLTMGQGWTTEWQDAARAHVVQRRQAMAEYQLRALDSYLQTTQSQQIDRLRNAGAFDAADEATKRANALPFEVRQAEARRTEESRFEAPAYQALASDRPEDIKKQLDILRGDPRARAAIEARKREGLVAGLDARYQQFEGLALANESLRPTKEGDNPLNPDETAAFTKLEGLIAGKTPGVQAKAREFFKQRLADLNEQRKSETARVFAVALQQFQAPGADGKPRLSTAVISPVVVNGQVIDPRGYLTDPRNGKEAADLWNSLLGKEQSAQLHDRQLAEKPTEAQWRAYGALVKDMQDNPTKYRSMDGDRFTAEVYGTVGPLIPQAMSLYKSVNEPKPDPRHLSPDELKAAMEVAPKELKSVAKLKDPNSIEARVYAELQTRLGQRKEAEWANKPGPVPQALIKQWAAEEFARGTVPGGWFRSLWPTPRTKIQAQVQGQPWTPSAPAPQPAPVPAPPPSGPAPAGRISRTLNGETRVWDGKAWVKGAQ